ncbi:hypothetical protein KCM76_24995 [Zooshikella marina]|uniref:hypothetical protein n=1 Tax=Zooshikella ganghwensis TaxID=202772 RepID=UPI001BAF0730|nr:hypothetical protein [Zooshikella ganghwensis]MBU2709277.1 hypothetical protein [Zooshikella ganghwensis]
MLCWICENEAKTGEHLIKASDLKSEFGKVTQKQPLYLHYEDRTRKKINSIKKSNDIKSKALLCAECNNARTSDYDKSWAALSTHLRKTNYPSNNVLRLDKVFPGKTKEQMLNVHLFFVKLFGCLIVEYGIPINIYGFQQAILNRTPHSCIHISIGRLSEPHTGVTEVHAQKTNTKVVFANWLYAIGNVGVNVVYSEPGQKRRGLFKTWHPTTVSKKLKLKIF